MEVKFYNEKCIFEEIKKCAEQLSINMELALNLIMFSKIEKISANIDSIARELIVATAPDNSLSVDVRRLTIHLREIESLLDNINSDKLTDIGDSLAMIKDEVEDIKNFVTD